MGGVFASHQILNFPRQIQKLRRSIQSSSEPTPTKECMKTIPHTRRLVLRPCIYFSTKPKTQWVFGPTLGSTKNSEYSSAELSTAKCPADPANVGQWMRKTSFLHRWQKEKTLKLICMK